MKYQIVLWQTYNDIANHLTINNIFAQLNIERNCSIIEKNIVAILKHMEI